jgi:GT2 family glycosyltransferase/glycosyltransferase involved in cell wall biosynthesis
MTNEDSPPRTSIVVPIYNAYDATAACLEEIEKTLSAEPNCQVLLIDDASPDPQIKVLLDSWSRRTTCVHQVILRPVNGGFIQTVNQGLQLAKGDDVVVLNSDTEPLGNWLSELRNAIESNPSLGIAFPATNNASIFSVPVLDEAHRLLGDSIAKILAAQFHGTLLSTPTAVGFCMFLTKKVLAEVGLLDTGFGRGYGEENDFCMRARSRGFQIAWVPSSLVLHEGGASMVEAGVRTAGAISVPENENRLRQLHPGYEADINETDFRLRLESLILRIERCVVEVLLTEFPPVVHVLQLPPDPQCIGGIEKHVRELADHQKLSGPVVLAYPTKGFICLRIQMAHSKSELLTPVVRSAFGNPVDTSTCDQFANILESLQPNYVHIHSLIGFSLDLPMQLAGKKIKTVLTIHDYYLASPDVTLLNASTAKNQQIQELDHFFGKARWHAEDWASKGKQSLEATNLLIAPTQIARSSLEEFLGALFSNMAVLAHPLVTKQIPDNVNIATGSVLFLGSVHRIEKGANRVNGLVAKLVSHNVTVHLLGSAKHHWDDAPWKNSPLVHFHGRYRQDEVVQRISDCAPSLGILVSPWAETWSYTLTELWMAGVPVAVGPTGSPAERINEAGLVLSEDDTSAAQQIVDLLANDVLLKTMKARAFQELQGMTDVETYLGTIEKLIDLSKPDLATAVSLQGFEAWRRAKDLANKPDPFAQRLRVKIIDTAPDSVLKALVGLKKLFTKLT